MNQAAQVIEQCGKEFQLLSGDDFTVLPLLAVGGRGVISVISNIMPKAMSDMCRLFAEKDLDGALDLSLKMAPVNRAMFLETNPIPVKTSLNMMGIFPEANFRLPSSRSRTRTNPSWRPSSKRLACCSIVKSRHAAGLFSSPQAEWPRPFRFFWAALLRQCPTTGLNAFPAPFIRVM